jgi:hypothetical protein
VSVPESNTIIPEVGSVNVINQEYPTGSTAVNIDLCNIENFGHMKQQTQSTDLLQNHMDSGYHKGEDFEMFVFFIEISPLVVERYGRYVWP